MQSSDDSVAQIFPGLVIDAYSFEPNIQKPPRIYLSNGPLAVIENQNEKTHKEDGTTELDSALPEVGRHTTKRWNKAPIITYRIFSCFLSFIVLGANDAAYGALIPYLEDYYDLSYSIVSLVFLSPVVGCVASALLNNRIHTRFGQRGIAIVGPVAHLIAYVVICLHPPFPVLIVIFMFAGLGQGLASAAWNAWVGDMANPNELLGFLHGFYGLGAVLSPLIATSMITKSGYQWYEYYYVQAALAATELAVCGTAFWSATAGEFRREHPVDDLPKRPEGRKGSSTSLTRIIIINKITWFISGFLLAYVGIEVALGGWTVTFMLDVRHGAAFASGMTSTGYWLGITVGRVVLGFVTARIFHGVRWAISVYLICTVALQLVYWLVPNFYSSAVAVALVGFFLGPMSPATMTAFMEIMPKHLHVTAIGFSAAFGAAGACILPYAVGAIAQQKGVAVLQPFILAMLVVSLLVWLRIGYELGKTKRLRRNIHNVAEDS